MSIYRENAPAPRGNLLWRFGCAGLLRLPPRRTFPARDEHLAGVAPALEPVAPSPPTGAERIFTINAHGDGRNPQG